jgi:hypothetical protein
MNPQKPHYVQSQFMRQHSADNQTAQLQLNVSTGSSAAIASVAAAPATGTAKEPSRDMV